MANELDASWKELRGFEVLSVGIASVSYDEESKKLINMRNQGAMLGDAGVREGYVQGAMARGFEAAGSNSSGSAQAFMGMGIGMGQGGGFMAAASETNRQQMAAERTKKDGWTCSCGAVNSGKFCSECGKARPVANSGWTCSCGAVNSGKFCSECGKAKVGPWFCTECGKENEPGAKFCSECGAKR
jgi:membrane protease subunit (stomatin/prohibitin family)